MRHRLATIVCLLLLVACGGGGPGQPAIPDAHAEPPRPVIVVVGDSISAGYMPHEGAALQLRQDLAYTAELAALGHVATAAVGGATSAAARYQAEWLAPLPAEVVVVMLGVNDADKGMARAESLANVRALAATWPRAKLVLVSPPSWGTGIDAWLADWERDLQAYALTSGAAMVPIYSASLSRSWRCHPSDRHPCAAGHREIGAAVAAAVRGALVQR